MLSIDLIYDRQFFWQYDISSELRKKSYTLNSVRTKCSSNFVLVSVIKVGVVDTLMETTPLTSCFASRANLQTLLCRDKQVCNIANYGAVTVERVNIGYITIQGNVHRKATSLKELRSFCEH